VIAPFGLRHLGLMRELQGLGSEIDRKYSLLEPPSDAFWAALRGYLFRSSTDTFTFVMRASAASPSLRGFVQARWQRYTVPWVGERASAAWSVSRLAPELDSSEDAATVWYRLLLHLCIAAGEQTVQRLFARVVEDGPAEEVFRQAGFSTYCHENVFRRIGASSGTAPVTNVRSLGTWDHWGVQRLWVQVTPYLVQSAEAPGDARGSAQAKGTSLSNGEQAYVWSGTGEEILGYIGVLDRPRGVWLRTLAHPDSREAFPDMLDFVLGRLPPGEERPVYCAAREYQGGTQLALADRGFELVESHSLLVKHTTARVHQSRRQFVPALEKRAEITPTVSRSDVGEVG